tara:strand:+ start:332 stop:532 length:201 start_codon:yes stop_codon:yes gene_type:complete
MKLKPIFSDDKVTVADVDVAELHKNISYADAQEISNMIADALNEMEIKCDSYSWDINVTVEMPNET